jgi:hypothetical protein
VSGRARTAGVVLAAPLLLGAGGAADLALPRDGLRRDGSRVRIVVENRGDLASPPATLELRDRTPVGGTVGASSPYPFLPNRSGVWVFQEPDGPGAIRLTIGLGSGLDRATPGGEVRIEGAAAVEGPSGAVARGARGASVAWDPPGPRATTLDLRVVAAGDTIPRATILLRVAPDEPIPLVFGPDGGEARTQLRLPLDAHRREPARRRTVEVPPLPAGGRKELTAELPAGWPDEVFAWVDPLDGIDEIREGNNVACWRPDRDRVTLAALHLHSSFSEGAGSVDWQVLHAAASGYDLLWWSEHEWRMACRDHVTAVPFGADDAVGIEPSGTSAGAVVDAGFPDGEDGGALRLEVPRGEPGAAVASLSERRRRITYSLAADVTLAARVLARDLDPDDRFTVLAELSTHPGEKRRIAWVFRWEGTPPGEEDRSDAARQVVARTIPTGSWITVDLPLSRDAAALWPNGADDNLQGLRLAVTSGGSGASVLVDGITVRHGTCGDRLRRVQESWMEDYPNVAHLFAEEVSYGKPHLNQYGGPRGLFDGEAAWREARAADLVERVVSVGGIVSWCHPLGVSARPRARRYDPEYQDTLVALRFGGAAVLEVGFRRKGAGTLEDHLALWDEASRRGIVLTGIGVNDSHEWEWGSGENNFATWLAAPADDETRLLAALRSGRAVFGDPLQFRGRLSLECGRARPGDVLAGSAAGDVVVRLEGAPPGAVVRLVVDGSQPREWTAADGRGEWSARLEPGEAPFVRAEVRTAAGKPLAGSNPIWFDPEGRARRP